MEKCPDCAVHDAYQQVNLLISLLLNMMLKVKSGGGSWSLGVWPGGVYVPLSSFDLLFLPVAML